MDLRYNGQYRMIELNSFFIVRNNIDDIMLVPYIMEKMYQLKVKYNTAHQHKRRCSNYLKQAIIQGTLERPYKAIQGQENAEDRRSYRREACGSPFAVRKEQISELHWPFICIVDNLLKKQYSSVFCYCSCYYQASVSASILYYLINYQPINSLIINIDSKVCTCFRITLWVSKE